jgi:hypothetical protein
MNVNARNIIYKFGALENRNYLQKYISNHFNLPVVNRFLADHIHNLVDNAIGSMEQELDLSDPMPGVTINAQVASFNREFINSTIGYIIDHVVAPPPSQFVVTDGMPTSRFGPKHHNQSADRMLQTWAMNPARGVQGRDDTQGSNSANAFWGDGGRGGGNASSGASNGAFNPNMATGITFCDQSDLNTSNHVEQLLGTFYMQKLNKDSSPHTNDAFGNSTPASDARLLSRRTFRNNEQGVENGIENYKTRIHRRNVDRDVSESLQGTEREGMIHGHDMSSLYRRVDHKREVKAQLSRPQYGPGQHVPTHPAMRHGQPAPQRLQNGQVFMGEKNYM